MTLFFFLVFFLMASPLCFATTSIAQQSFEEAQSRLTTFDQKLTLAEKRLLQATSATEETRLDGRLRNFFEERLRLREEVAYWQDVLRLKKDILSLKTAHVPTIAEDEIRQKEAEAIAQEAIRGFHELRRKYTMLRPAVFQNMLINAGFKKEGFCWHWTRDFFKRLESLGDLKNFDLHWATAHEGKVREHNTLVISSKGLGLEDGLLLDGWRHSGKPFWTGVATDHYPWKPGTYAGEEIQ